MCGWCGDGWRFETVELGGPNAGRVKAVLHPISAQWENAYSQVSAGSIVLSTQDPSPEDLWPGATGLYISQVMPDGSRRARFGGYVPKYNGAGGGATTVAFHSIDKFLDHRLFVGPSNPYRIVAGPKPLLTGMQTKIEIPATPTTTTQIYISPIMPGGQAGLAAFYVNLARGGFEGEGITGAGLLSAVADPPYTIQPGDPTPPPSYAAVNWWDFKNIGQAVRELVEAVNGVKYWLEHTYTDGYWATVMHFSDSIGVDRDYTILSDREAKEYALEVDAEDKATRVYGVGSGDEGYTQFSVAYDADDSDNLPEHQATVAWKDQTDPKVIDNLTQGYVVDHRDPVTVPSATIMGLPDYDTDAPGYDPQKGFPGPEILQPGDTFDVEIGYGVITVKDIRVRALAVAWSLSPDETASRTIAMQPIVRANDSVRTQTPTKPVGGTQPVTNTPTVPTQTIPWPKPGLISHVDSALTEISGMQNSHLNPGYAFMFDDEQETPQVRLVHIGSGDIVGSHSPNPGPSGSPVGDPEAIRLSFVSGELVLADTGDNDLDRPTSGAGQPHLVAYAEPKGLGNKGNIPARRLPIAYPGGERINVETLLINPSTDEVLLVSKEETQARVFSFGPLSAMSTSNNVGVLKDTLDLGSVSDGTHARYRDEFVFLRSTKKQATLVYSIRADGTWKYQTGIATPALAKGEAITVEGSCSFLVTTEGSNAPVYRVLIPATFGALCNTQAGDDNTGTGGGTSTATVPGQVINMTWWKWQGPI